MHDEHQASAELAYRLWEARGRPEGEHERIWLDAERQIQRGGDSHSTPADNAAPPLTEKWHSVGIEPPGSKLSDDKNPNVPEKLARR
jgi:hypothetical protein